MFHSEDDDFGNAAVLAVKWCRDPRLPTLQCVRRGDGTIAVFADGHGGLNKRRTPAFGRQSQTWETDDLINESDALNPNLSQNCDVSR